MNIIGIIPARYASTRFPGKPLVDINGKTMIQRVYEQALGCELLNDLIVATDDERIANHVKQFGGKVEMTSPNHQSGTDRCCEVIQLLPYTPDAIINIQGDEPFIQPEQISMLAQLMSNPNVEIGTLIKEITDATEITNENVVKVVADNFGKALYFSRCAIPFQRNKSQNVPSYYKHIGMYGYKREVLQKIAGLKPSAAEISESLEQLRWLQNGYVINTAITNFETFAVDSPDDLKKFNFSN